MKCSHCGLESAAGTKVCDCGKSLSQPSERAVQLWTIRRIEPEFFRKLASGIGLALGIFYGVLQFAFLFLQGYGLEGVISMAVIPAVFYLLASLGARFCVYLANRTLSRAGMVVELSQM